MSEKKFARLTKAGIGYDIDDGYKPFADGDLYVLKDNPFVSVATYTDISNVTGISTVIVGYERYTVFGYAQDIVKELES